MLISDLKHDIAWFPECIFKINHEVQIYVWVILNFLKLHNTVRETKLDLTPI